MQNSDLATCCRSYGYWPVFTAQLHNYIAPTEHRSGGGHVLFLWLPAYLDSYCLFVNYLFCWHTVASYREASVYSLDNCPWILASLVRSVLVFFRHIQETLLCFLHLSFDFMSRAFQLDHLGLIVLWPTGYLWWLWSSYLSYVHCLALFSSWCLPWFMPKLSLWFSDDLTLSMRLFAGWF